MLSHDSSSPSRALAILIVGAWVTLLGCKSDKTAEPAEPTQTRTTSGSAKISNEVTATADVWAIERDQRWVTLRREDGSMFALKVSDAARNFDQLAIGDTVKVRYRETLVASQRPAGESATTAKGAIGAGRTEAGAKPGGAVGLAVNVRVKVESIDLSNDIIVSSLASGELWARRLTTQEGRNFIKGLRVGDVVQLDYTEALALTVEEM